MAEVKYRWPLRINLTDDGKTVVVVYAGEMQAMLVAKLVDMVGEPEQYGYPDDHPETKVMLFPHQNLPDELMDIAERMTGEDLLLSLGSE